MMTLIALAITVAFVFSAAVAFGFPSMALREELATLVTIMLLGHWLEMRSIAQAQGAPGELAKLLPSTAVRVLEPAPIGKADGAKGIAVAINGAGSLRVEVTGTGERTALSAMLDVCLVTEQEPQAGPSRWQAFVDPLPEWSVVEEEDKIDDTRAEKSPPSNVDIPQAFGYRALAIDVAHSLPNI
jgi:Cu2+-exporting ATPase